MTGGSQNFRLLGDSLAWIYVHLVRTGGTVTVPADGNTNNLTLGTVPASWAPIDGFPLGSGASGRITQSIIIASAEVDLVAVAPGANIVNNDHISFGGLYIVNRGY